MGGQGWGRKAGRRRDGMVHQGRGRRTAVSRAAQRAAVSRSLDSASASAVASWRSSSYQQTAEERASSAQMCMCMGVVCVQ